MEGDPRRLWAPVRNRLEPKGLQVGTSRLPPIWMTQPVRLPGLPAKECAPQGVRIVPEVIRHCPASTAVCVPLWYRGGLSSTLRRGSILGGESRWLRHADCKSVSFGRVDRNRTRSPCFARSMAGHAPDKRGNLVRFQGEAPIHGPVAGWCLQRPFNPLIGWVRSPPGPPF
jgi:hypothetical protein